MVLFFNFYQVEPGIKVKISFLAVMLQKTTTIGEKSLCFTITGSVKHKLWVTVNENSSDLQKILAGCCQ